MILPAGFEKWNPAMRGAYLKGAKAFTDGKSEADCPYEDKRKDCGRLTWSRAFIAAWWDGFEDAKKHAAIDEYYQDRNNSGQAALSK